MNKKYNKENLIKNLDIIVLITILIIVAIVTIYRNYNRYENKEFKNIIDVKSSPCVTRICYNVGDNKICDYYPKGIRVSKIEISNYDYILINTNYINCKTE